MKYLTIKVSHMTVEHLYEMYQKDVETLKQPRTRKNANSRARSISIENPLMPNMQHLTKQEWYKLGHYQRAKKVGQQWQIEDYCKYCTDFLIERPQEDAEDPCVQCGIRDQLQNEHKASDSSNRESSQYKIKM